ncbi:MAG: carboxypeptidase-like regulatory domain-containing protein, partial [Proteiniphilum sp.]|nr:carboxypeptidase-like regulatory domain-containing protein [Proteiniphilum sp.]
MEVGTAHGTVSDIDGNYSLEVNGMESTLQFSYIGFEEKQIKVGNQTLINVTMSETTSELDEIVIVGYGTMKKKD